MANPYPQPLPQAAARAAGAGGTAGDTPAARGDGVGDSPATAAAGAGRAGAGDGGAAVAGASAPSGGDSPTRREFDAARRSLTQAVGPAPRSPPTGLEEQLAAAREETRAALAELERRDSADAEPVVLVVGMVDGGCVCGGGASLHKRCHRRARWVFPLASLCTLGLFVVAQVLNQGVVYLTVDAPPIRLLLPKGLHTQQAAQNATYWQAIQSSWDAGATVSTALNAGLSGILPIFSVISLNVCWFFQSPRVRGHKVFGLLVGVLLQCSKMSSWFLVFSFLQSLAFQYELAFDWNGRGDKDIQIKMDVAATLGAYAMTVALVMFQLCANGCFVADRYINGQDSEEKRARRQASGGDEARPLLLCVWRQMAAQQACRPVWLAAGALLQLAMAALVLAAPLLTWRALTQPSFQLEFKTQIEWNIALSQCGAKDCSGSEQALLPLVVSIWNGAMQGPATKPSTVDLVGNKLFGAFFVLCIIVLPYAAMLLWIVVWAAPLRARRRRRLVWLALVCQAWNCLDLFFAVLATCNNDLAPVTAYTADQACEPLVDLIPKMVGQLIKPGEHCLETAVDCTDQAGFWWLLAAAAAQWMSLISICVLASLSGEERPSALRGVPGLGEGLLFHKPQVGQGGVQQS